MTAKNSAPVIVLGMHRSGTSLLAGSLEAAGLFLGEVNNAAPHNKKGNKENIPLRDLNDRIMARVSADWRTPPTAAILWTEAEKQDARALCRAHQEQNQAWGFKDPRTLWTLEGWRELFPRAFLVGVFRHPALVMHSLNDRPGSLQMTAAEGEALWYKTNKKLMQEFDRAPFPLLHFDAENMQTGFFGPLGQVLARLGLDQKATEFFTEDLVHQTAPTFSPAQKTLDLYAELRAASADQAI